MHSLYNVLDVAHYIVKYCNEHNYNISNLKLQKLLYFVQAYFLVKSGGRESCFKEKIEAWSFGPVVPEAYYEYRQYGSLDIPYSKTKNKLNKNLEIEKNPYDENIISNNSKEYIESVVEHFKNSSASDLVELTHRQAPWKNAFIPFCNQEITCKSIVGFFLDGK